jgi:ornithine cyclodeaminase/alanine dehydrogenase-like protein (mu-crystallin family)
MLAWTPNGKGWWKAETIASVYEIGAVMNGRFEARVWERYFFAPVGEGYETLEAAQAACEQHERKANHEQSH